MIFNNGEAFLLPIPMDGWCCFVGKVVRIWHWPLNPI